MRALQASLDTYSNKYAAALCEGRGTSWYELV